MNFLLRLRSGFFWNIINTGFTQASVFIANIAIARILGREVFGEFAIIQSTLLACSAVAQIATGSTALKYVAEYRIKDKIRCGKILGLCTLVTVVTGIIGTIVTLFASPWLTENLFNAPHLLNEIMLASGFVMFSVMNGYQAGALAGLESFRSIARASMFHSVIHLTLFVVMAITLGLPGVMVALLLSSLTRWALFNKALRKEIKLQGIRVDYSSISSEKEILYKFSLPAAISGFSTMPAIWLSNTILVQQVNGFSQMGLYNAAVNLKNMALYIPSILYNVTASILNYHKGSDDYESYRKLFFTNVWITVVSGILVSFLLALLGRPILQLYGNDFIIGYSILLIMLIGVIFEASAIGIYQVIQSKGKMWLSLFAVALPRDITLVTFAFILIPRYSAEGLAISYAVSAALALLATAICAYRVGLLSMHTRS